MSSQLESFEAELAMMSDQEVVDRMRTDGNFMSNILGRVAESHPEIFETTSDDVYSTEELANILGVELPEKDNVTEE